MIEIIPAIDIINGECVRLKQGNYGEKSVYNSNPVEVALNFKRAGFKRLHLIDLDGAKADSSKNLQTLSDIYQDTKLEIDFGGGIKSFDTAETVLNLGAKFLNVGSMAVLSPEVLASWFKKLCPDKFIVAVDVLNGKVRTSGWTNDSNITAENLIEKYMILGVKQFMITDISKDGMLEGPNLQMYRSLRNRFPDLYLIASGGVSNLEDVKELNEMGMDAVIIGKAIYEGKIELEALKQLSMEEKL